MKKIILITVFVFCASLLFGVTYNTPTIDGSISVSGSDWDSDELIVDDPTDDSAWGTNNEFDNLWLTWDADNLYIGIEDTASGNAMIVYLDMDIDGGETDFNSNNGYTGAYPRNITFDTDDAIDLMIASWDSGTPGVWTIIDSNSTDISGSCTISGTTSAEVAIPWNSIYGLGAGTVPTGASLKIVGVIAGGDNWGACDSAPDNADTDGDGGPDHLTNLWSITIDSNGDGSPDSGVTLPVVLSTFTVQYLYNTPTLYWVTQSETDNLGWYVYRNAENNFTTADKISNLIEGHGTTSEPSYYLFKDSNGGIEIGQDYYYWLASVDLGGEVHHYNMVANLQISDESEHFTPIPPVLHKVYNSPNPFRESTTINFTLFDADAALVQITVYNMLGERVKTLPTVLAEKDVSRTVYWDGKNDSGQALRNGIYFYQLEVNGKVYQTKRAMILK